MELANELLNFGLNRFAPIDPNDDGSAPNPKDGAALTKAIREIDSNGDGMISPTELVNGIRRSPPLLLSFVLKNVFAVASTINTVQIGAYFIYPSMIRPPYLLSSLRFTIFIIAWMTFHELREKALSLGYIAIPRNALLKGSETLSRYYGYMCCKTPLTTVYNRLADKFVFFGVRPLKILKWWVLKIVYADPVVVVALVTAIAIFDTPSFFSPPALGGIGGASAEHPDLAPWCNPDFDWCADRHWWCTDPAETTAPTAASPTQWPTASPTQWTTASPATTAAPTEDYGHDCDPDLNWKSWDRNWGIAIFIISLLTFLTGGHLAHYILDWVGYFLFPFIVPGINMGDLYPRTDGKESLPWTGGPFMKAANANTAESGGSNWAESVSPRVRPEGE